MRVSSKKVLVFAGVGLLILFLLILWKATLWFLFAEADDDNVLGHIATTARQLQAYHYQNGVFPDKLEQINSNERVCVMWRCYEIKYQVSPDKQNFTLVSAVNYPFIAYSYTQGCAVAKEWLGCSGYVVAEKYSDFPVYKQDPQLFATPSAWPDIPKTKPQGEFFSRLLLAILGSTLK